MDVSVVDREEFERSRNALAIARRKETMNMDDAISRLENFYINTITLKYGEYRERLLTSRRRLEKLTRLDNAVLEMEDDLRADEISTISKKEFMERFNNLEEKLYRDKIAVIKIRDSIKSAEDCINGLVVGFANFVFENYRKVPQEQRQDFVLDVVDRLALSEAYQDEMRRQFTESILDEIVLRIKENADLAKKIEDVRARDSIYVENVLRSGRM